MAGIYKVLEYNGKLYKEDDIIPEIKLKNGEVIRGATLYDIDDAMNNDYKAPNIIINVNGIWNIIDVDAMC